MVVGVARFSLRFEGVRSLKEKRGQVRTVVDRLRHRFEASVAEVGALDAHQRAEIGVAVVSNERAHAERMVQSVLEAARGLGVGVFGDVRTEVLHVGASLPAPGAVLGRWDAFEDGA
ncbi:MAG: DUF503 domain-containing protein [Myxococcota bacterium]